MSRSALINLLRNSLAHRYLAVVLAAIAVLTMIPCLWQGWTGDDLIHRAWLVQPSQLNERLRETGLIPPDSSRLSTAVMNLFSFTNPHFDADKLIDSGLVPWWTSNETSLSFWRPLAALTHWIDYRLWPDSAMLMHAHSLFWFGAVIIGLTFLYRRMLQPAWVAGLAALFYALDDSYYVAVSSLAARNAMLSLFFGILALLAHDRWRQRHSTASAIISVLCFLLALLSAEAGIATMAYLVAYALLLDRGNWPQRALSLTPSLTVIVVWRFVYNSLGYGVRNSGLYVDPLREPVRFAASVIRRGPILLLGEWGLPPTETYDLLSAPFQLVYLLIALALLALVLFLLLPLLRKNRVAAFWGVGMLLSVVPACSANLPRGRLLVFVGIGTMGLVAQFLSGLFTRESWIPSSRTWRIPAWGLCLILIVLHVPAAVIGRLASPKAVSLGNDLQASMLEVGSDPDIEDQNVTIVNSPSPFLFLYFPFERAVRGAPFPLSTRILAPAFAPLKITRADENTLVVSTQSSSLLSPQSLPWETPGHLVYPLWRADDALRAKGFSMVDAERIVLTDLAIEVSDVGEDGLPKEVVFQFVVPLDDPSLRWLMWDWQTWAYVPFRVPAVGESVQIAGPF